MKAKLLSPTSFPPEWEIELEQFPAVIGHCADAAIQPLDASVSERHCELENVHGRLMVRDLGSRSGTFVNGVQVEMAPLLPGDKLTVGQASFIASYDPPLSASSSPHWNSFECGEDRYVAEVDLGEVAGKRHAPEMYVDLVQVFERQRQILRQQDRVEPRQRESMFPDPPHPEHIEHLLLEEMKREGVPPQFIYAFEKTGILVTEFNYDTVSEQQLAAWHAAVQEYLEQQEEEEGTEQRYPLGAVAMYGPDKSTTTMIMASVIIDEDEEPVHRCWNGSRVAVDPSVKREITDFFRAYRVRSVIQVEENVGCPHLEGEDYPAGTDCPFCPYWKGKQ